MPYMFLGEDEEPVKPDQGWMASLPSLLPQGEPKTPQEARKQARQTTAVSIGGGAIAGASVGMVAGPIGALVGAGIGAAAGGIYGLITGKKSAKKAKKRQQQEIAAIQTAQASEKAKKAALEARDLQERTRLRSKFLNLRSKADAILRQMQQRLSQLKTANTRQYQEDQGTDDDFSQLIEFFEAYKEELEDIVKVGAAHLDARDEDGLDTLTLQLEEVKAEINAKLSGYRPMYVQGNLSGDGCGAECDCAPCKTVYGEAHGSSTNISGFGSYSLLRASGVPRGLAGLQGDELGDWLAETRSKNRKALGLPPLAKGMGGMEDVRTIEAAMTLGIIGLVVYAACKA